jgi:predicted RNA-binding Zn-ribbon protein involved in translation (DUF1610 family)
MAMFDCPECQAQISDSAFKCPKCGVQLRKSKRGFMGKLFKWSFIGFSVLMAVWAVSGFNAATSDINTLSGAEQAGAAIGTGLAMALVMTIWVIGAIILGLFVLFTRPKSA